jgi:hypothetical protein
MDIDEKKEEIRRLSESIKRVIEKKTGQRIELLGGMEITDEKLVSLLKEFIDGDDDRNKVFKCMPCLTESFKRLSKKLNGDPVAYAGAIALATLQAVIRRDVDSKNKIIECTYTKALTITLLKFCETMHLLEDEELENIRAKYVLQRMKEKEFDI